MKTVRDLKGHSQFCTVRYSFYLQWQFIWQITQKIRRLFSNLGIWIVQRIRICMCKKRQNYRLKHIIIYYSDCSSKNAYCTIISSTTFFSMHITTHIAKSVSTTRVSIASTQSYIPLHCQFLLNVIMMSSLPLNAHCCLLPINKVRNSLYFPAYLPTIICNILLV